MIFKKGANGQLDNANPRGASTLEFYRKCCPGLLYTKAERAEACHKNNMENAPFFIGAILAGNLAGLDSGMFHSHGCSSINDDKRQDIDDMSRSEEVQANQDIIATMNTLAGAYIGLRLVYSFMYVKIQTNTPSYLRSVTWTASVAVLMTMFVKAGNKMNSALGL
jgi:uncharacterized MAPEG superfamily protein